MSAGAPPPFERSLHVVTRERLRPARPPQLNRVAGFGVVAALLGVFGWEYLGPILGAALAGGGIIFMRVGFMRGRRPTREMVTRPAHVRITNEGVAIEDEAFVPRDRIVQAYYQPRRTGLGTVRALDAAGEVLFELETKGLAERNAVLRALGADVAHGRAWFEVGSPFAATTLRRIGAIGLFASFFVAAIVGRREPLVPGAAVALLVLAVVALSVKRRVEVGLDGLHVQWLGRSRFVPWDTIRSVERRPYELWIERTDGSRFAIAGVAMTRDALAARIDDARRAFAERVAAGDAVARVGRGSRRIAEWRADLARLHEADASYRDAPPRGEDLWRIVEDAGAPEDARAGAAVALRKEDGAAARLRVAADTAASPRLRVALEKASDPGADDAALDEALEAVARQASR